MQHYGFHKAHLFILSVCISTTVSADLEKKYFHYHTRKP